MTPERLAYLLQVSKLQDQSDEMGNAAGLLVMATPELLDEIERLEKENALLQVLVDAYRAQVRL